MFTSSFWKELFHLQGTKLRMSSSYHPQTDGQTEVVNRCLEAYLRCFTSEQPKYWSKWLHGAEYSYNTTFHSAIKMTPFKAVYGRDPPKLLYYGSPPSPIDSVDTMLQERDDILTRLKQNLLSAPAKMKKKANMHRRDLEFVVGDKVYLRLQPYRMKSLAKRVNEKLSLKFFGPFTILQRVRQVAYKLDLLDGCALHPVFHISKLRRAIRSDVSNPMLPPSFTTGMEWPMQPSEVVSVR